MGVLEGEKMKIIGNVYIILAAVGASLAFSMLMPILALIPLLGVLGIYFMAVKINYGDELLSSLGRNQVLLLWITKSGKCLPEIVTEDEGYLKREWGRVKVAPNTAVMLCNKKAFIGAEGIPYTLRFEYLKIAEWLEKLGIHTKEELAKFLGVPRIVVDSGQYGKREESKPKGETGKTETPIPSIG